MKKIIVLTGGGTAGHVIPNIALLPNLKKHFAEIHYIGSKNGIEKQIIAKHKEIIYHEIETTKLVRKLTLKNLSVPFVLIKSIMQCKKILQEIKPDVIFSKGGYVAVPVVLASSMLKIPVVAHESDSTIGLANKIIYKKCKTMFFSFEEAMKGYEKKGKFSGSPIRQEFLNKNHINRDIPLDKNKKTIVVVGGSLGSKAINNAIITSLDKLQNYNIVNIVGKGKINTTIKEKNYLQYEYLDDIAGLYNLADLVISRAGSNAIFELLAIKKLMILIPLPKDESRGDQIINANIFEKNGFAKVIDQADVNKDTLYKAIDEVFKYKQKYIDNMSKVNTSQAVEIITKELIATANNDNKC